MPRYIDVEKIVVEEFPLKDHELIKVNECAFFGRRNGKAIMQIKDYLKRMIDNAPTEDVIPRSEVDNIVSQALVETRTILYAAYDEIDELKKAKQEVASDILKAFSQFRALSPKFCEVYYNFEKKYIGESKDV